VGIESNGDSVRRQVNWVCFLPSSINSMECGRVRAGVWADAAIEKNEGQT
jgi:hypothetical protein